MSCSLKTDTFKTVLLIGCGSMGRALLKGLLTITRGVTYKVVDPHARDLRHEFEPRQNQLIFYDVDKSVQNKLITLSPMELNAVDLVIFAVKPALVDTLLKQYKSLIRRQDVVITSVAAAVPLDVYQNVFPVNPIVRIMPNTPVAVNRGVIGLYTTGCTLAVQGALERFFGGLGMVMWVNNEDEFDRLTAISGCGPGYIYRVLEAMTLATKSQGFDAQTAEKLVLQTVLGALNYADLSQKTMKNLRQAVASSGGMTQAGLDVLDEKIDDLIDCVINKAYCHSRNMMHPKDT